MKREWKRSKESLSPCAFRVKGTSVILCSPRDGAGVVLAWEIEGAALHYFNNAQDPENLVSTPCTMCGFKLVSMQ